MGKARARKKEKKAYTGTGDAGQPVKPAREQSADGFKWKWYLLLGAVLLVTFACYANSLNNTFVFDDALVIAENPGIRGIKNIPRLLGLTTGHISYRPIRMVSYALDYTLNQKVWQHIGEYDGPDKGLYPLGYHIANVAYHLLTSLLVFLVVARLSGNVRAALLAAGIFALHPVHTDSVTYLSGRRDILFTLFYLAGFYFFLRYRQGRNPLAIMASFVAYILSMGSKEMGVTLPALFLCYDVVANLPAAEKGSGCGRRLFISLKKSVTQSAFLYVPLFFGALAFTYYKIAIASPSYQKSYYGDSAFITFLTVAKILVRYVQLLFYPVNLIADYSFNAFPLAESLFAPAILFSFLLLGGIVYALYRLLSDGHELMAFGGIWFFLTLLPVLHIFPHHELLAEHYLYLPSIGFCLLAAVLCDGFMRDGKYRLPIAVCLCAILAFFALRTIERNSDWKNSRTLYEKTVKMVPECARANANLCEVYVNEGMIDEALAACKQALAINPDQIEANNNLGTAYARKGMIEEALASYRQALVLRPRYAKAYFNIGLLLFQKGDLEGAVDAYKQALAINFSYAEVRNNLGRAYSAMGRFSDAIDQFKWALEIKPGYASARTNLAIAYMKKGDIDDAIAELEKAAVDSPADREAQFNLGYAYSQKGDFTKAADAYKRAIAAGLSRADVHSNLGNIYLQQGRLDEAISEYLQALSRQENFAGAHNNLAMAYFKKKDYARAIQHCDRAAELGLSNPTLLRDLQPYR